MTDISSTLYLNITIIWYGTALLVIAANSFSYLFSKLYFAG